MADYAHNYTDKQLEALEKRFQSVYRQAEKEVNDKLNNYLHQFKAKDDAKRKLLEAGKITEDEYKEWRYGQMMTGKRWKEMRDQLAQDYTNANQNAVDAMNRRLPDVFAENTNYSTYEIENGLHVDTSFTMYDRQTVDRLLRDNPELLPQPSVDIPKDLRWNRQKIQGAIEQGILQGESIPDIAKRLQRVTDMNKSAATRNARTAMTGAQNGGRIESYKRARDLGIDMRQCWLATMDGRVRHSHAVMDGETQEVGKEFSNGCMYPGDPNGPPAETWNCRCTLIAQLKGFEHDVSQGRFSKLDDMSYDEWKEYHRQALERKTTREVAESGVNEIMGERIDPKRITPVNQITDYDKYGALVYDFKHDGYSGRPIVAVDMGDGNYNALTGSHRVFAGREADIEIPTVIVQYNDDTSALVEALDDEQRARIAEKLYKDKKLDKDAYRLLTYEEESNAKQIDGYAETAKRKAELWKAEKKAQEQAEAAQKKAAEEIKKKEQEEFAKQRAESAEMAEYKRFNAEMVKKYGEDAMWGEMTDSEMDKLERLERIAYKGK